jgi:hypothetical protein
MKKLFYAGLLGLVAFEVLKVYFIMPMPGSQRLNSVELAYALHGFRWAIRVALVLAIAAGARAAIQVRWRWRWLPVLLAAFAAGVAWFFNFKMTAESIFKEPQTLVFQDRAGNKLAEDSLVIGVEHNGEAKAWPIRFIVYHHQVQDTVGGKRVLVTYCSVCRTGRVFEPLVEGQPETFRLVGMDHFNAMFEDARTGSWWRQANGEAIVGPRKGATLPAVPSVQLALKQWFDLHPKGRVMQADAAFNESYDLAGRFERGESKGSLTRTDPVSWQDKSWVVGVAAGGASKAYDWNLLKKHRVINDRVGDRPIVLAMAADGRGFAAFERRGGDFTLEGDVLVADGRRYDFVGRDLADPARKLPAVPAHQEFWHSWRTFHPDTARFSQD